jgi:hypothetical protein
MTRIRYHENADETDFKLFAHNIKMYFSFDTDAKI